MRIAIDAMGGDHAPAEVVKGAVQACERTNAQLILVGREADIQAELDKYEGQFEPGQIIIRNAEQVIEGDDHPVQAVRRKKDSSMLVAIDLVRDKEADAALSAGNTGALMVGGLMHLGRIEGVERPAIVYPLPNISAPGFSLLADAGANAECKASNLLGFARMGTIYMKSAFGIESPTVGLINIGTEETKGTEMLKEAHKLLKESELNFIGNVEAREIPSGAADILVCDGFTGNIVLKLTEGVAWSTLQAFKGLLLEDMVGKMGGLILKGKMSGIKKKFDYTQYGAAPILGLMGPVFKMHGNSNATAVESAVVVAAAAVEAGFEEATIEALKQVAVPEETEKEADCE